MCRSHRNFSDVDMENILKQYNLDSATFEALRNGEFPTETSNDELENNLTN